MIEYLQKLLVDSTVSFKPPSHFLPAHVLQANSQQQLQNMKTHLLLTQSQSVLTSSDSEGEDSNQGAARGAKNSAYWSNLAQLTPSKFVEEVLNVEPSMGEGSALVPPSSAIKSALGLDKLNRSQHAVSGTTHKPVSTSASSSSASEDEASATASQPKKSTPASVSLMKDLIDNKYSAEDLITAQQQHQQVKKAKQPKGAKPASQATTGKKGAESATKAVTSTNTNTAAKRSASAGNVGGQKRPSRIPK